MFIFGFFKWILIGIIAFIIVIMSSIRTSDWNFPKDEIINAYNTFLQNFCVAGLSKDKDIEGKRVFGTDKYVGTYKAEYDNGNEFIDCLYWHCSDDWFVGYR